ncbi:MAG: hypothetical protein ACI8RA_002769, partial [Chlamydiales bacterium]
MVKDADRTDKPVKITSQALLKRINDVCRFKGEHNMPYHFEKNVIVRMASVITMLNKVNFSEKDLNEVFQHLFYIQTAVEKGNAALRFCEGFGQGVDIAMGFGGVTALGGAASIAYNRAVR